MSTGGFESGSSDTKCSSSIHDAIKGLLQSVAVELYNPPRHPPLTLLTDKDRRRFNPLALHSSNSLRQNRCRAAAVHPVSPLSVFLLLPCSLVSFLSRSPSFMQIGGSTGANTRKACNLQRWNFCGGT